MKVNGQDGSLADTDLIAVYRVNDEGVPERVETQTAEHLEKTGDAQIAAVGDKVVVLDADSGKR